MWAMLPRGDDPERVGCGTPFREGDGMGDVIGPCLVLMAGGAGVGKTGLARMLVRRVPSAVLLDKDRLLGRWVDRVLVTAGMTADRDSRYYWQDVRPEEYATLETIAFDHLELGKVAVVDAPLRPELEDSTWVTRVRRACADRGAGWLAIWVTVSTETARRRMTARAEPRDRWKLANWEEFLRRQPYDPPAGAGLVVTNEDSDTLEPALSQILAALTAATRTPEGSNP
jgi:predicted kinase